MSSTTDHDAVWVASDRTLDDAYVATIHPSPDVSIPLDRAAALAYVAAVYEVCARAEYDAAVADQIGSLGPGERDDRAAAGAVMLLRERRPPLDNGPTGRMQFRPLVSSITGEPLVHVHLDGQELTQWSTGDARSHAGYVLDAAVVADLDAAYLEYLSTELGVDLPTARRVVDDLARHRRLQ